LLVPIIISILYFMKNYQPDKSIIFNYLSFQKFPLLYEKIMQEGKILIGGYNRATASINELMYFILYLSIIIIVYFLWSKNKNTPINIRMGLFVGFTSLFILIPLFQFSSGLFGVIAYTRVVNRLYYSSSLFILLPIFAFYITNIYNLKLKYMNLFILLSLISVFIFSKHNPILFHNYYKNIQSIKNSFIERKVGFNLSNKQIELIGQKLKIYEAKNHFKKKSFYYARADIAFVLKYIYSKNVHWEGRHKNPDYKKIYKDNKDNKDYRQILFETPKDFPQYRPYT